MRLRDALLRHPDTPFFARYEGLEEDTDDNQDDPSNWEVEPIDSPILRESETSDFFIVRAKHILPDGTIHDCYINLMLPERVSDFVYVLNDGELSTCYHHEVAGEVICAVPIDAYGDYELFYSRIAPDSGIKILKKGLELADQKSYIAEDLGYILRDENRMAEAAEMFQISANEEPTSPYIYSELAACYQAIGKLDLASQYEALLRKST
ncbi:hypothetical protein C5Y96_12100 [Blastopirellula marina]|uniref:Tetratricopeptide repeat protein n=1 Tax=Blastopirellula marina TaxID=124 RepID=A0A2S8FFZ5_9BACT|nr:MULTISPECIES: hypothetical protein [Pirellulaceae]PQO31093.1 hypothetical protein C5Y96_12100 [Blastopirellula marina]RCS51487.1 hypothetical protein DTL36_12110 [Bremerella cremea]